MTLIPGKVMSLEVISLLGTIGWVFLIYGLVNFVLGHKTILGIPNVMFELLGLALISLNFGSIDHPYFLMLMAGGAILAMMGDPFIWYFFEKRKKRIKRIKGSNWLFSFIGNGLALIIIGIFYYLGSWLTNQF